MHRGHHGHLKSDDSDITTVKIKVALGAEVPPCCIAAGFSPATITETSHAINLMHFTAPPPSIYFCVYNAPKWYFRETASRIFEKYLCGDVYEKSSPIPDISLISHHRQNVWQIKAEYYFSNPCIFTNIVFHELRPTKKLNIKYLQNFTLLNHRSFG